MSGSSGGTKDPIKIVANIFISFIGAGVLGLPYAFKRAGLMEGILVMCFVSYFAVKAMILIIDCKYKLLNVIYQYEDLTEDFQDGETRLQIGSSVKKVKAVNGTNYVELKCSDIEDDTSDGEDSPKKEQ